MNIDELMLNINVVKLESLVTQAQIQSSDDVAMYQKQGYMVDMTAEEFSKIFNIDPANVCFLPSISCPVLYFNRDTLAVCNLPLYKNADGEYVCSPEKLCEQVERAEKEAANKVFDYMIFCLPASLRFHYLGMLVDKYGAEIPNLYEMFMSTYHNSDYGFSGISADILDTVLSAKTAEDTAKTQSAIPTLPDIVTVYRGEGSESTPYTRAYSWTTDLSIAYFFACRRGKENARIISGTVAKEDILEYDPEGECEAIIRPGKVAVFSTLPLHGMKYIELMIPVLANIFLEYKEKAETRLNFSIESTVHDLAHELRVLLLCLMLSAGHELSSAEIKALCTAAIYHDTRRLDDNDDPDHGARARAYYEENEKDANLLVSLLCEYHCRPDEEGYTAIRSTFKNKAKQIRYCKIYDIFKDADALDRVRFGLTALDENQLRTENAKRLPLVARLLCDGYKT